MIGDKYVLWEIEYKSKAYQDQFKRFHPGYVIKNEYEVTVVEERQVKGMWGGEEFSGVKAVTSNGKEFTRNWNSFPDDSMTPTLYWDSLDICDAIQLINLYNACVDENGNPKYPKESHFCPEHNNWYLRKECWICELRKKN